MTPFFAVFDNELSSFFHPSVPCLPGSDPGHNKTPRLAAGCLSHIDSFSGSLELVSALRAELSELSVSGCVSALRT